MIVQKATVKKNHLILGNDYLTVEVQVDAAGFTEGEEVVVVVSSPVKEQETAAKIKEAREYIKKYTKSNHAVALFDEVIKLMTEGK
jgi:hypothetical protein